MFLTSPAKQSPLAICVGVITRERPELLRHLLQSLTELERPPGARITIAVVENHDRLTLNELIEEARGLAPWADFIYEHESRLGIPFARNRILDLALESGCDLLAFIDDDETADRAWLVALIQSLHQRHLDLTGGPVRLHPHHPEASFMAKAFWRGLVARGNRIERQNAARVTNGSDGQVTIVTNNWLGDLDFFRRTGLRFDEALGFSGGSDTRLYRQAIALGAKTGWTTIAHVREFMPSSRLTFGYQYRRARDQTISSFHNKYPTCTAKVATRSCFFILSKICSTLLLSLASPFDRGSSLLRAVRTFGAAVGRLQALCGRRSQHYRQTHGA